MFLPQHSARIVRSRAPCRMQRIFDDVICSLLVLASTARWVRDRRILLLSENVVHSTFPSILHAHSSCACWLQSLSSLKLLFLFWSFRVCILLLPLLAVPLPLLSPLLHFLLLRFPFEVRRATKSEYDYPEHIFAISHTHIFSPQFER